jgi:hypothetical protein
LNDEKEAYLISYKATNLYNITVHLIIENFDRLQNQQEQYQVSISQTDEILKKLANQPAGVDHATCRWHTILVSSKEIAN